MKRSEGITLNIFFPLASSSRWRYASGLGTGVDEEMRVDEKKRENNTDYFLTLPWHIRVDGDMRVDGIFE